MNSPSNWRKTAYRAALDLAEGRVSFDPDEYIDAMLQNPGATHVVMGQPEIDDDCPICRMMREQYGAPEEMAMADGSIVEIYGPMQRRQAQ